MSRLKVLAIAFACNPSVGSEYGVGWGWVNAIAADHDVTVITADFNADDIESSLGRSKAETRNNLRFVYVKNRPWHYRPQELWLKIEGSFAKPLMNLAYQDWLGYAFAEAKRETTQNHYDLVHLITFVAWRFPGRFYQLGIPFVWGPIGGLKNTPWHLFPILGVKGAIYYGVRNLINSLQLMTLQQPRRALRAADKGIIAATSEIQEELWHHFRARSRVICEVGPPELSAENIKCREKQEPLRVCWSGQHLVGKALHLLLHAAAQLPEDIDYRIEILGDGPCRNSWRNLAIRLKVDNRCRWHGWLPRSQSLAVMRDSHVLAITSLKDLTSTVAVEAVSLGLPVVCLDHCGFADLVTAECGIRIHPGSARQIIAAIAGALCTLYQDEAMRRRLAEGAISRSRDYSWLRKMDRLNEIYALALQPQRNEAEEHLANLGPATD
jgi:glycosyltransferase involved in cell wall biosynthesis